MDLPMVRNVSKRRKPMSLSLTNSLSVRCNSTRLLPYIILGGQEAVNDRATLDMLNVTHVLNVSQECKAYFEDVYQYMRIPITDEPDVDAARFFGEAHDFLQGVRQRYENGEKVCCMVHCKTGMSRSSTMVLAHMMISQNMRELVIKSRGIAALVAGVDDASLKTQNTPHMTLRDALAFVRERRTRASPNVGFMQQLVQLETTLHRGVITIDLAKYASDRFGPITSFCLGEVDPVTGYGLSSQSPGLSNGDEMLLSALAQADYHGDFSKEQPVAPADEVIEAATVNAILTQAVTADGAYSAPSHTSNQMSVDYGSMSALGSESRDRRSKPTFFDFEDSNSATPSSASISPLQNFSPSTSLQRRVGVSGMDSQHLLGSFPRPEQAREFSVADSRVLSQAPSNSATTTVSESADGSRSAGRRAPKAIGHDAYCGIRHNAQQQPANARRGSAPDNVGYAHRSMSSASSGVASGSSPFDGDAARCQSPYGQGFSGSGAGASPLPSSPLEASLPTGISKTVTPTLLISGFSLQPRPSSTTVTPLTPPADAILLAGSTIECAAATSAGVGRRNSGRVTLPQQSTPKLLANAPVTTLYVGGTGLGAFLQQ